MTLLSRIRDDILDPEVRLSTVLRYAKVLAHRLKSAEFETWVDNELNGYEKADTLPDYRIVSCVSYGNFVGPFGRTGKNLPIITAGLPDAMREAIDALATKIPFSTGIRELESIAEQTEKSLKFSWPANAVAMIAELIYDSFVCMGAWRYSSVDQVVGILDTVRNRLLNFILKLDDLNPDAGEDDLPEHTLPVEKVTQLFQTVVQGNYIAVAEAKMSTVFDQRGQVVNTQYNAANDINFGAVQTAADVVGMLEQIQNMLEAVAKESDSVGEEVIDAEAHVKKAVAQSKKPQADKKSIVDHLNGAKALLEGVASAAGVVKAIAAAVPVVQKLLLP